MEGLGTRPSEDVIKLVSKCLRITLKRLIIQKSLGDMPPGKVRPMASKSFPRTKIEPWLDCQQSANFVVAQAIEAHKRSTQIIARTATSVSNPILFLLLSTTTSEFLTHAMELDSNLLGTREGVGEAAGVNVSDETGCTRREVRSEATGGVV